VEFRRLLNGTNGDFRILDFDFKNFGEYLNKEMSQNFHEFFEIQNLVPEPWFQSNSNQFFETVYFCELNALDQISSSILRSTLKQSK